MRPNLSPALVVMALALAAPRTSLAQNQQDREFRECPECPVMVGIPAGSFVMGSPPTEPGRFDAEGPQHVVLIKAFALGKYDVTPGASLLDLSYTPQIS